MIRKIFLPSILLVLAYGFWISPDFKEISAGVAIFLFGMLSLEEGFRTFTGGVLENLLRRTTDKLWKSLSFGMISTTIMHLIRPKLFLMQVHASAKRRSASGMS